MWKVTDRGVRAESPSALNHSMESRVHKPVRSQIQRPSLAASTASWYSITQAVCSQTYQALSASPSPFFSYLMPNAQSLPPHFKYCSPPQ
ncbi:hypothetical protein FQZ97_861960 [compost metagenome]